MRYSAGDARLKYVAQVYLSEVYQLGTLAAQHGSQRIQRESFDLFGGNGWWNSQLFAFCDDVEHCGTIVGQKLFDRTREVFTAFHVFAPDAHRLGDLGI